MNSSLSQNKELDNYLMTYYSLSLDNPFKLFKDTYTNEKRSIFDMHYVLELGVVAKGSMERHYPDYFETLEPGGVWLSNVWEPHGFVLKEIPCTVYAFIVSPEFLWQRDHSTFNWLTTFALPPEKRPKIDSDNKLVEMIRIVNRLDQLELYTESIRNRWIEHLFFEILLILQGNEKFDATNDYANKQYSFQRIAPSIQLIFKNKRYISIEEAAAECNCGRNTFISLFKQIMGISFVQFCLSYRLSNAARDLINNDLSIKEISVNWGFTDISHLNRYFHKIYGMSPSEYKVKKRSAIKELNE
jgi:AraC-like DNA-binding protein